MTSPTTEDLERLVRLNECGNDAAQSALRMSAHTLAREVLALRKKLAAAEKVVAFVRSTYPGDPKTADRRKAALTEWENTND